MRVFVTGIAGFLGSHVADAMLDLGHEVVGIDNLIGGDAENVPAGASWHQVDCNDLEQVRQIMSGTDLVYHCAATAYEGLSVFSPHLIAQNIVGASAAVFSAAADRRVKRIVHCSSMARYGVGLPPFREYQTPAPVDPYGIAKLAVEQMLVNLCTVHGIEYAIAVPHNIIGPRQKYDDPYRNVASIMINLVLQHRRPTIYGDGKQTRCFSYIDDCLSCLVKMGTDPHIQRTIINIGPDEEPVTINELYETISSITGFHNAPIYRPGRPQEVKFAVCSSDKARQFLGYKTRTSLRQGIRKMVNWIDEKGTKPFCYHLPVEIRSELAPRTWTDRLF